MSFECLECGREFKALRGLHAHLKKHDGVPVYYQKHYPRRDLLTGDLIDFENVEKYMNSCFNSVANRNKFLKGCSKREGREVILTEVGYDKKRHNLSFLPPQNFFILNKRPGLMTCEKFFGNRKNFAEALGLEEKFNNNLPSEFWEVDTETLDQMEIHIDTREKKPFEFKNGFVNKLDFGDYCAGGEYYSSVFVDRKSCTDFKGTFGVGIERFIREIERAKKFDSKLFIVVESTIPGIIRENYSSFRPTKLSYSFANVKKLLIEYSDHVQFVFCKDKEQAKDITQRILYFNNMLHKCDVQYYVDKRNTS